MGIKEKLPLVNNSRKSIRIIGYIMYGFILLIVLGAILPSDNKTTVADTSEMSSSDESTESSNVLSHSVFGNYTFDGQEDVKSTVKKGTDPYHMIGTSEIVDDVGYTRDGAQYIVTSTGKKVKGYVDYSGDGYVILLQPRRSSMTKNEFMDVLNTFRRVE
jgi:hypothetical protein